MTDRILMAVASIPSIDLTLDGFSNRFVFATHAPGVSAASDAAMLSPFVAHFYTNRPTGATLAVQGYFAPSLQGGSNNLQVKIYDISTHLDGTPAGAPVSDVFYTCLIPAPGQPMPEGVAAALSFRSDYGTDPEFGPPALMRFSVNPRTDVDPPGPTRPRARDRGRIYVGPLSPTPFQYTATTNRTSFTSQFMNDLILAFKNVAASALSAAVSYYLSQWSEKNQLVKALTNLWVDDRPDYQRRRSDQSTTRTTATIP